MDNLHLLRFQHEILAFHYEWMSNKLIINVTFMALEHAKFEENKDFDLLKDHIYGNGMLLVISTQ